METTTIQNVTAINVIPVKKVVYTGKVQVTGGRDGYAKSDDGRLQIDLTSPGATGIGTNPEQLFAAGWSACFIGAMTLNAAKLKLTLPADLRVDTEVDLATGEDGYFLQARLNVTLPGMPLQAAHALVEAAHQTCPYSKLSKGNINVQINVAI